MSRPLLGRIPHDNLVLALVALVLGGLLLWDLGFGRDSQAVYARNARQLGLVRSLRATLAAQALAASEAVLAGDDQQAASRQDAVRQLGDRLAAERTELSELLGKEQKVESGLLGDFTKGLAQLEAVDRSLAELGGQNTNLKAYALAYGPAAQTLEDFNQAADRLVRASDPAAGPEGARLALSATIALYRMLALLPVHIAEADEGRMDALEATLSARRAEAGQALDRLAALPGLAASPDLARARKAFADFNALAARILDLSRQNTNVRALAILLGQKRNALAVCEETLQALENTLASQKYKASR